MWLTKVPGVEPTQKTNTFEKGTYAFFSPTRWERVGAALPSNRDRTDRRSFPTHPQSKTEFTLVYEHLEKAPAGQPAA